MRPPDGNNAEEQDCAGEAHKALVRRFVEEAVNQGNLEVVARTCAPRQVLAPGLPLAGRRAFGSSWRCTAALSPMPAGRSS
jgi:hypothetical protein